MILSISCQSKKDTTDVKTGDIIFVDQVQSALSQAINDVTNIAEQYQYTHMGLIERAGDSVYVIHASPEHGVERILISDFICHRDTGKVAYHIYRLQDEDINYDQVISAAKRYIGLPYNWSYELSDTAQYCSELIFNAFEGFDVFSVEPMTFKDRHSDSFNPVWADYFKKRNQEIPEGALGCNPNKLSQHKKLKMLFRVSCLGQGNIQLNPAGNEHG